MLFKNYYRILGISRNASFDEIKRAYRKKAMENHPDRNRDKSQEEQEIISKRIQIINEAYESLGGKTQNVAVKSQYDEIYDAHYRALAQQNAKNAQRRAQSQSTTPQTKEPIKQEEQSQQQKQQEPVTESAEEKAAKERARRGFWQYNAGGPGFDYQTFNRTTKEYKYNPEDYKYDFNMDAEYEEVEAEKRQESPFISSIKQAWKEVREEEKKVTFKERHAMLDKDMKKKEHASRTKRYRTYDEFGNEHIIRKTRPQTQTENIIFNLRRGTVHIAYETLAQLEKLSHVSEDSIPKFVIRNRNVLAATLVACIIASGPTNTNETQIQSNVTSYSTSTQQTLPTDELSIADAIIKNDEDEEMEARINREYIAYRTYKIQSNDTLTKIAANANCTISEIERENDLKDSNLIKAGQSIIVPYHIESGDLMYATFSAYCEQGSSLEEFAKMYSTDVRTIIALNGEAIVDGVALTDSLLVPNFATQAEIAAKHSAARVKVQ